MTVVDDPVFTSCQAAALAGVTYRQLDYYARIDLVTPTHITQQSGVPTRIDGVRPGSGQWRRYTLREVAMLAVAAILSPKFGGGHHQLDVTRQAVTRIRTCPADELASLTIDICDHPHPDTGGHAGCPVTVTVRVVPILNRIVSAHSDVEAAVSAGSR